ncbi:MAG: pseudouridine-5'-phosphate glycosidase [Anaerolineae bacterium]|nr:pseudouridine-5'-phosphate glycosidase [Anaerolineae bacterium]
MEGVTVAPHVAEALALGRPVVALESALITHGMPAPVNLDVARQMEAVVEAEGAVPATVAVVDGQARVGLAPAEIEALADHATPFKVSLRDLPAALAQGRTGGTTVAATMALAHRAGVAVFATGGIGGVHRGHPEDVSADLMALSTTPMTVVCAGAKAILDLPRTLEALETLGVPVVGYGTDTLPAFTSRSSGLPVPLRADTPAEVAAMMRARAALDLCCAILVCVPIPEEAALPWEDVEGEIAAVVAEAEAGGIAGRDVTPFLLARLSEQTAGRSRDANVALLLHNACMAARIACSYAQ